LRFCALTVTWSAHPDAPGPGFAQAPHAGCNNVARAGARIPGVRDAPWLGNPTAGWNPPAASSRIAVQ
jgi:hypothetical protein